MDEVYTTAIRLHGVTKQFDGASAPAVDALDLEVPTGSIVALIGPSGCGKTTTLRMVNRLIEPTSGRIEINGVDALEQPAVELRCDIGYVIQQVGLFPHRTIAQNIATRPTDVGVGQRLHTPADGWTGRTISRAMCCVRSCSPLGGR